MQVLITGGYGFIGSFVAERFHKEGYGVTIIDNLSTGDKRNIDFKHKAFALSVEDTNCEEIFRSYRFDVVVHLAAQVDVGTSMMNPRLDAQSNVLGLSNMLSLAQKYGVPKFIFASSAAVYGALDQIPLQESSPCDPISPYGINKWIGETYCRKWGELYGLETLCFRFSNVYGPRQGSNGEGGVISLFMEGLIEGKDLSIYGDGGQTRDFIYVEDVADAIYRSSLSTLTGVYNLSTYTESSVNDLINALRGVHGSASAIYKDKRPGDIYRSVLDNAKIMRDLDWAPKYALEEGLRKTYEWFLHRRPHAEKDDAKVEESPSAVSVLFKKALPYLENGLAFALTAWLTLTLEDELYGFIDLRLIYILILGMIYGNRQSILAVLLSVSLYVYQQLHNGREFIALFYDTEFFFHIAVYLFVGLVVGYSIERKNNAIQDRERQTEALGEKYAFLTEVYNETRLVKDELQRQIMTNGDSFGKIYSVTKELESLEPEKILTSTVSVVESIMKSQTVTIYMTNKDKSFLRLMAQSHTSGFEAPKSVKVEETSYLRQVLHDKKPFINKELVIAAPLLAAPVLRHGEVIAVISVQRMEFEHFTLYYQNLFKVIVDLISSALSRALSYVEATSGQRFIEGTPVLKAEVFSDILDSKKAARAKHGVEFVLLTAGKADAAAGELPYRIARLLRETDYIGLGTSGQLLVLLTNSNLEEAAFVLQRFEKAGISLRVAVED
ncbi:GDP-mannose 4,6-dehydratase [Paenibacillus sp. MZ04-78.2]|uniref:NAD-dependent epimerase/dehydratase family protein n=1 Tax=Paenibacillus sp. MZ04-78.2 TaxID=2962034 RepID=UPI0020B78A42|nr:NAD-dependent epimerase/dehydratase family protein [Paenibacillus sp. MZ04-78.2]MCP3774145.1 GDP-mannose 4,6-dehydratase [Paenibacillus sp. MZ04-78.2]